MATTRPSLRADDNSLGTWGSARKSSSMRGVRDTQSVSAEALAMAKQILSSQGLNDGATPSGGSARDLAHHALLQHLQHPTASGSGAVGSSGSFHQQRGVGARRTSVESLPEWEPQMRNFDSALLGLKIPQTQAQAQVPPAQQQQQQLHTQYQPPHHNNHPQLPQKLTASVSFMDAAAGAVPQPQQQVAAAAAAAGGHPPPERLAPWLHLPEEEESVPPTPPLVGSVHQMSPRRNAVETLRLDVRRALEMVQENAKREMLAELEEAHEEEERFALENGGIDEDLVAAVGGVGAGGGVGLDAGALGSRQVSPLPPLPAPVDSELLRAVETEVHDAADTDDDGFESMSNADMYSCCSGGSDTEETTRQAQAAAAAATATAVPSSALFTVPSFRYSGHEDLARPDELHPPQNDRSASPAPASAGVVAAPSAAAADEFVEISALVRETHALQHQQKRSSDTQLASIQALQEQQHMTAQQMHDLRVAQMQQQAAMQDQYTAQQELLRLQQEDTRVRARQAEEDTRRMVEQIELEKQRGRVQAHEAAAAAAAKAAAAAASPSDHLVSTPSRHSPEPATPTRAAASPAQAQTYYTPNGKPYVFDPATGKSRWVKTTSVMSNSPARSIALSPGKATHGVIQLNIVVR